MVHVGHRKFFRLQFWKPQIPLFYNLIGNELKVMFIDILMYTKSRRSFPRNLGANFRPRKVHLNNKRLMASQAMNDVQKVNTAIKEELDSNGFIDEQQKHLNGLTLDDVGGGDGTETATDDDTTKNETNGKGNEEKKIFCGGISYETSNEDLTLFFGQYGKVKEVQVKYDRMTGRSRGFAFVEFDTVAACQASLVQREQVIKGKQCEIKPAKSREVGYMNKKVFVGGLPGDFPEEELRKHFTQYGKVEEIEWPFDKQSRTRKNFAFVVFDDEESADRAAALPKQHFASRECDVKKAVPQSKRSTFLRAGNMMRNAFIGGIGGGGTVHASIGAGGGGNAIRGGPHHHHHHHQQQQQMPLYPNAASAAAYAHWYYNAAAAAAYGAGWYTTTAPAAGNAAASAAATPTAAAWFNGQHHQQQQHHHHQQQHHHHQHNNAAAAMWNNNGHAQSTAVAHHQSVLNNHGE
uniref:RRM domain-containing protein n=1 Tax=Globodera rostochiensis TaxID=31243 RepID=A0A914GYZ4_GLORO